MSNNIKKVFFLVGLPRAGNTLLSSILNQNSDIAVTANSITADILYNLFILKDITTFKNFPDHKSFNNIAYHVFDLYYKDWKQKYIIDRSSWGTRENLRILKETHKDIKIIVLIRDLIEVLASFILWSDKNPNNFHDRIAIMKDGIIEQIDTPAKIVNDWLDFFCSRSTRYSCSS